MKNIGNGFYMEGYYIWGGSVIKENDVYNMFASRWAAGADKEGNNELDGYRSGSEIVHAVSNTPEGPYTYKRVVIGKRDKKYWDSQMAHNPYIIKINNTFVLFYIGKREGDINRKIGYAISDKIDGDFIRQDREISLIEDVNNPAPYILNDKIAIIFRDRELNTFIYTADNINEKFNLVRENVFKEGRIEDFCVYNINNKFHMLCEDNEGIFTGHSRYGAHMISDDGLNWKYAGIAYNHEITDIYGKKIKLKRRERPQLLIEDDKKYLITSALMYNGKSKCIVVPFEL